MQANNSVSLGGANQHFDDDFQLKWAAGPVYNFRFPAAPKPQVHRSQTSRRHPSSIGAKQTP